MPPALLDIGYFEHTELGRDRGRQGGFDLSLLQLLQQFTVLAQLVEAESLHLCLIAQLAVDALGAGVHRGFK